MILGAVIGAAISVATTVVSNVVQGKPTSLGEIAQSAVVGAVSGAVAGLAGPEAGPLAKMAVGALSSGAGQMASNAMSGKPLMDGVGQAALIGGVTGGAMEGGGALLKGAGSFLKGGIEDAEEGISDKEKKMNLEIFIDIYDLHDSGIKNIHYFPDQKKLVIDLIFCNWKQTFYKAEEPELVLGELIFTDVSHYRLQEIYKEFGQSEILSVNLLKEETNSKNRIEIVISSIYLSNKEREVKLIEIETNDVVWKYVRAYE